MNIDELNSVYALSLNEKYQSIIEQMKICYDKLAKGYCQRPEAAGEYLNESPGFLHYIQDRGWAKDLQTNTSLNKDGIPGLSVKVNGMFILRVSDWTIVHEILY